MRSFTYLLRIFATTDFQRSAMIPRATRDWPIRNDCEFHNQSDRLFFGAERRTAVCIVCTKLATQSTVRAS